MGAELETLEKIATDVKEGASAFTKLVEDNRSSLDKIVAEFKEAIPKAKVEEAGALANIAKTEFMGVEVGKIAIGTFGGVFVSELVDGFLATQTTVVKGAVKLAMAGVVGTWGKRWVGRDAGMAIALILGVFGLSQILPVDKWATGLASSLRGILPGTIKVTGMPGSAVAQATRVAEDYYGRAFGR